MNDDGKDVIHHYPSLILGYTQFPGDDNVLLEIITSTRAVSLETCVTPFKLGTNSDRNYVTAPLFIHFFPSITMNETNTGYFVLC